MTAQGIYPMIDNDTEVSQRVVKVISEVFSVPVSDLLPTTKMKEDLGADSMQVVTLLIALDEEFDTEFDISEVPAADVTVKWVCEFAQVALTNGRG
jgi:acyl carrier protein